MSGWGYMSFLQRNFALLSIFGFYGLFSSMIPSSFGAVDAIIALFLVMLCWKGFFSTLDIAKGNRWSGPQYVKWSLIYLVMAGCFRTDFGEVTTLDVIRDLFPLAFLYIPILVNKRFLAQPIMSLRILCVCIAFVGCSMTIRHFMGSSGSMSDLGTGLVFIDEGISLGHDPTVAFTAILFAMLAVHQFCKLHMFYGMVCCSISAIPTLAMIGTVARGPLALLLVAVVIALVRNAKIRLGSIIVLPLIGVGAWLVLNQFDYFFESTLNLIIQKTQNSMSTRELENLAVLRSVFSDTTTLLFGSGWGARIESPLGGEKTYVHNLYLYILFKTGSLGLIALLSYAIWIAKLTTSSIRFMSWFQFSASVSATSVLVINSFFEVGFKTIMFGFILTVLLLAALAAQDMKARNIQSSDNSISGTQSESE